jgi:hypothetical protein
MLIDPAVGPDHPVDQALTGDRDQRSIVVHEVQAIPTGRAYAGGRARTARTLPR